MGDPIVNVNVTPDPPFSAWALIEMMGHRKEWGRVTETTIAGTPMLRIEAFRDEEPEPHGVMFVPPGSIYAVTVMPEDVCRRANSRMAAMPTYQADVSHHLPAGPGWSPSDPDPTTGEPPF